MLDVAQTSPIMSPLPTLIIAILFGLAMDYQVSWAPGCARSVHGAPPLHAVTEGFRHGARVLTAATLMCTTPR